MRSLTPSHSVVEVITKWLAVTLLVGVTTSLTSLGFAQEQTVPKSTDAIAAAAHKVTGKLREGDVPAALDAFSVIADSQTAWHLEKPPPWAAAAGGIHRALSQVSSEEQFDLLSAWTMPTESRSSLRVLTVFVPTTAPPVEFARALGERPRPTSFPIASVGGVRGLFSTAAVLVDAAKESGRLRRLIHDLEPLAAQNILHADMVLWLARLADERVDDSALTALLDQRLKRARERHAAASGTADPETTSTVTIDPTDVLVAAAALERPALRAQSEALFQLLLDETASHIASSARPFLHRAYATALLRHRGKTPPDELLAQQFSHWISVPGSDANEIDAAVWLTHEDYALHLTGTRNDVLLFRYPLTGDFRFQCETQGGGKIPTDGGLTYGGWSLFPQAGPSEFTVWDAHGVVRWRGPNHYIRIAPGPTFNQHAVVHRTETTLFQVNRHILWDVVRSPTSPWLGLRTLGDRRTLFRHLSLSGSPVIPRAVSLLAGDDTLGWQARTFGEPQPKWFTIPLVETPSAVTDWAVTAGELRSPARPVEGATVPRESLLSYQRPILDSESVTYDFQYQPGAQEVHPAIGRVVFLLQPDGVRLHWITNGADEWTALPIENTIVEPLNRRGPKSLPLNEGEWNQVTLRRRGNEFSLSLNDTEIYQRTLDATADCRFGLYRDSRSFGVHVKNVILTGEWPQEFPEELRQSSMSVTDADRDDADRHALNRLLDDANFADDVIAVRQRAASLTPEARLEYLTNWILPGPNHAGFRVAGDFTPVDSFVENAADDVTTAERGGNVVSPVYDWLNVAREQAALPMLRERVMNSSVPADGDQQRARLAVLALLHLELDDKEFATKTCAELLSLVKQYTAVGIEDQWPESLVIFHAVPRFPQFGPVGDLLNYVYSQRTLRWLPANSNVWHSQMAKLAMAHRRAIEASNVSSVSTGPLPPDWIPGSNMRSVTRGMGYTPAEWEWRDDTVTKISGHDHDFLFYRYPLQGDFVIECDLSNPGQFRNQVLQAGVCIGPRPSTAEYEYCRFGQTSVGKKIEPKLSNHYPWVRYRAAVRDGQLTVFLNGRTIHTEAIADDATPWVGLRAWGQLLPSARDFRIFGNPTIPAAVPMATSTDLLGWYTYNVDEGMGTQSWALWKYVPAPDDETSHWILGREFTQARGNSFESTLCYGRPLAEGDRIDYEFYYQPGKVEGHPAIDRTAFMLTPEGVREHWITDCRYERMGADPNNVRDYPEFRRTQEPLPLKPDAWNRCEVSLREGRVQLRVNDQLVYERPFNPHRQPTFGLFHYADRTEVRVRNIFFRGDWPKSLPSVTEQSLAHSASDEIDADRSRMTSVFEHDFVKEGLPAAYFLIPVNKPEATVTTRADGVHLYRETTGTWGSTELTPRFSMEGDFDAELTFDDLQTPSNKDSGLQFSVQLDNEKQVQYRNIRTRTSAGTQELYLSLSMLNPDNTRVYPTVDHSTCEATSGRLRLSRRGDQMHFLFAEAASPYFRLLWTEPASTEPVDASGIKIIGICNGVGSSSVVVKHVLLRAERLLYHPDMTGAGPRALFVMKPDGTGLKTVALPPSIGYQVVGSAEFSRDGKKIAMDMSQGSTATSHLIVCKADGSEIRDIGPGCMPSFSPDGKQVVLSDNGIEIMNVDGTNRQILDASGWGTQWSPDGKWIAYGKSGNVVLMNPKTRATRTLLTGADAQRYSQIYWNLGWSHDSQTVGFKARRRLDGEDEIAVIDIDKSPGLQPLLAKIKGINPDITFTAKNDGVVFGMHNPKVKGSQLHVVYRNKPEEVKVLPNQPNNLRIIDAHWSRDGQWLTFSGQELPAPTEWTAELAAKKRQNP